MLKISNRLQELVTTPDVRRVISPGQIEIDFAASAQRARGEAIKKRIRETPAVAFQPESFVVGEIPSAPTFFDRDGINYNSRTEARYACLYHYLGLQYQYEPEKLVVGGRAMIPDFFLPEHGVFVEVGPNDLAIHNKKQAKAQGLADATGCPVIVTQGFVRYRCADARRQDVTPLAYDCSVVLPQPHSCNHETVGRYFPGLALLNQWSGSEAWDAVDVARNYRFEAARNFHQAA